ncbi:MAG: tyrosine--tRNA ligase [Gammaproteobacteria bacterium]|nr:tyrosine--tRNA ligase [Gammaproteobacteria bacterium]
MTSILSDLEERNVLAQVSDRTALVQHLSSSGRVVYAGFDPSAPSLHVGNLVPLITLRRFQMAGHKPIALVGGATGLIGDPSGREDERTLNDKSTVEDWVEQITQQITQFLDVSGDKGASVVNNMEWTEPLQLLSFLRDVGKHFSVNSMIQRDSVKSRLDRAGSGISFTEFAYMLLQANDYLELARRYDCTLQFGGSDQWGNIVSGMDLVRRVLEKNVYGLTFHLITKSDGQKYGKTSSGAVWLDPSLTSPYSFYQYWLNMADSEVGQLLNTFTLLPLDEREVLRISAIERPEEREAQLSLARNLTKWVHGTEALRSAESISRALFHGNIEELAINEIEQLWQDGLDRVEVIEATPVTVALSDSGLAASRSAARRLIRSNGIALNGERIVDEDAVISRSHALYGRFHLIRRGRKAWCVARHADAE